MMKQLFACVSLIVLISFVVGCGGMPKEVKIKAKAIPEAIKKAEDGLKAKRAELEKNRKTTEFKEAWSVYDQRENWSKFFEDAQAEINLANRNNDELQKVMKKNDRKRDLRRAQTLLRSINQAIRDVSSYGQKPFKRISELKEARDKAPEMEHTAKVEIQKMDGLLTSLDQKVQEYQGRHPTRKDDLTNLFTPFRNLHSGAHTALDSVQTQFKLIGPEARGRAPDYAVFTDGCKKITADLAKFTTDDGNFRKKMSSLDKHYTKTIIGMEIINKVQIGRSSWDNSSDWDTTKNHTYSPSVVDQATFDYFAGLPESKTLAKLTTGWGEKFTVNVDRAKWNNLKISNKASWPNYHDDAEYWLNGFPSIFRHKYLIVENDKSKETEWRDVPEDFYWKHEEHLDLTILSKPYGQFEDEAVKTAAPPGMNCVGNPRYGKWEKDPQTGERRWGGNSNFWMMMYLMNSGGSRHYYHHSDWNDYRGNYRGRGSYYGGNDQFGTYGQKTQSRYAGTRTGRSLGMSKTSASARGAGASRRGGGPKGGGK